MNNKFIEIIDSYPSLHFSEGEIVFKIMISDEQMHIASTKYHYENLMMNHKYNPLLYLVPLETRLAYIFGCLNTRFGNSSQHIFTFHWRKINTHDWHDWFKVHPYSEELY